MLQFDGWRTLLLDILLVLKLQWPKSFSTITKVKNLLKACFAVWAVFCRISHGHVWLFATSLKYTWKVVSVGVFYSCIS